MGRNGSVSLSIREKPRYSSALKITATFLLRGVATAAILALVWFVNIDSRIIWIPLLLLPFASARLWIALSLLLVAVSVYFNVASEFPPGLACSAGLALGVLCCRLAGRLSVFDDLHTHDPPHIVRWTGAAWGWALAAAAIYTATLSLFKDTNAPALLLLAAALLGLGQRLMSGSKLTIDRPGLALGVAVCIACLLLLEIPARVLFPGEPQHAVIHEPHAQAIYALKPGIHSEIPFRSTQDAESENILFRINNVGFRGEDIPYRKPDGEFRILCIGDSYTFGWAALEESSFVAQLESMLRDSVPGANIRVMNGGVGGQAPWQARVLLNDRGFPVEPDLVVLQTFMANDIGDTLIREGRALEAYPADWAGIVLELQSEGRIPFKLNRAMRVHSALYRILEERIAGEWALVKLHDRLRWVTPVMSLPPPLNTERPWVHEPDLCVWYPNLNDGWTMLQEAIRGIQQDCRNRGIPLAGFNIPWSIDTSLDAKIFAAQDACYEPDKGNRLMESFLTESVAHAIPMLRAFREHPEPARLKLELDGHLSREGNHFVAQLLSEALEPIIHDHIKGVAGLAQSAP